MINPSISQDKYHRNDTGRMVEKKLFLAACAASHGCCRVRPKKVALVAPLSRALRRDGEDPLNVASISVANRWRASGVTKNHGTFLDLRYTLEGFARLDFLEGKYITRGYSPDSYYNLEKDMPQIGIFLLKTPIFWVGDHPVETWWWWKSMIHQWNHDPSYKPFDPIHRNLHSIIYIFIHHTYIICIYIYIMCISIHI